MLVLNSQETKRGTTWYQANLLDRELIGSTTRATATSLNKGLMSRTIAVHEFLGTFLRRPLQNNNVK